MKLAYPIRFEAEPDGSYTVQGMAPLTNVITEGETFEDAQIMATEALTGVLAVMFDNGLPIPRPVEVQGEGIEWIEPDASVAAPILLRWAREDAHITQAELAARLGVTRQAVQRLERSDANPSVKTLARAMKALGRKLHLAV